MGDADIRAERSRPTIMTNLGPPHRFSRRQQVMGYTTTVALALTIVICVVFLSLGVAHTFALNTNLAALAAWGQWVGTFVASLALLGTVYAVITQVRQSETTSWSIALSRLGELYDLALIHSDLAQMLAESSAPHEDVQPLYPPETLKPKQRVWLGSLFLAYEQIFVATLTLSQESRRVWRIYLANQLNKPSLRAQFCRDAIAAQDYHQAFWRFVRGSNRAGRMDAAIDRRFFDKCSEAKPVPVELFTLHSGQLFAKPIEESQYQFWAQLYEDVEIRRQMYAAPLDSIESFKSFLRKRTLFTVFCGTDAVGGFSLTREDQFMATFGYMLSPEHRGKGYAGDVIEMLMRQAHIMGFRTLRADIYEDNIPSIRALDTAGFRKFIWMEKNLPDTTLE